MSPVNSRAQQILLLVIYKSRYSLKRKENQCLFPLALGMPSPTPPACPRESAGAFPQSDTRGSNSGSSGDPRPPARNRTPAPNPARASAHSGHNYAPTVPLPSPDAQHPTATLLEARFRRTEPAKLAIGEGKQELCCAPLKCCRLISRETRSRNLEVPGTSCQAEVGGSTTPPASFFFPPEWSLPAGV